MYSSTRIFSLVAVVLIALCSTVFAVELPDSIKVQVLELTAAGDFAVADSVEKSWTAKVELEQMQTDAVAELEKLQSEAHKNTYAEWSKEVAPMSYDSVWAWVDVKDTTTDLSKVEFLAERYNVEYDSTMKYYEIKTEVEFRQKIDSRIAKKCGSSEVTALNNEIADLKAILVELTGRVDSQDSSIATCENAIVELADSVSKNTTAIDKLKLTVNTNSYKVDAALDHLRHAKLNGKPNKSDVKRLDATIAQHKSGN